MICGLVWRLVPLGLPPLWFKYGGSALWAMMMYWIGAAILPNWRPAKLAVATGGVAAMVELSRLLHAPGVDAFRFSLTGKLLLGRVFSVMDIGTYWLAIAVAATMDRVATQSTESR